MPQPSPRKRRNGAQAREQRGHRPAPAIAHERGEGLADQAREAVSQVFVIPGFAILPMRWFLGITFIYAGIQKITDPGFFTTGSPTYIGTQIVNFGRNSPIHFLMTAFAQHAVFIGVLTIMTEITIGVLVTLGLFTRIAAVIGLTVNFMFFLSASWNIYPFFLGSDIVFCVCWLTLALTGPGAFSLDPMIEGPLAYLAGRPIQRLLTGVHHPVRVGEPPDGHSALQIVGDETRRRTIHSLSRREAVAAGLGTVVLFVLALIPRGRPNSTAAGAPSTGATVPAAATNATQPAAAPTASTGHVVGNVNQIPVNSALATTDPKSGDPAVVIHASDRKFYAYDAVCTHAGCTVQYDSSSKLLICPCHGGAFDPLQQAQVVQGPPPAPLTALPIRIDAQGNVNLD
jgi:thiosulfate dehydrogenase [quinone] large subunit